MKTLRVGDEDGRVPVDAARVTAALASPAGPWRLVTAVARTGSTNADLIAEARAGAQEGLVLLAEEQTAGRGRLGRQWASAPGAGLTFSVLLRPHAVSPPALGWLPLLAGVAIATAVREMAGVPAVLKWPNDVLVAERKLAGVLAESGGEAVVVGVGLNVWHRPDELPVPTATSLALEAGPLPGLSREAVLTAVLAEFGRWYLAWRDQPSPGDAHACGLRQAYLALCGTLGRAVTVSLPGKRDFSGTATGIGSAGQLEVRDSAGLVTVNAGDVIHLR